MFEINEGGGGGGGGRKKDYLTYSRLTDSVITTIITKYSQRLSITVDTESLKLQQLFTVFVRSHLVEAVNCYVKLFNLNCISRTLHPPRS